jgi:hypothetical protein
MPFEVRFFYLLRPGRPDSITPKRSYKQSSVDVYKVICDKNSGKPMAQTSVQNDKTVFNGKVVYIYAFDIAYEIRIDKVRTLLSFPLSEYAIGPSKRNPKYYFFYRPKLVRLPDEIHRIKGKTKQLQWDIKVFGIGSISVEISIPFEGLGLRELVEFHNPAFDDDISLEKMVSQKMQSIVEELKPVCVNPAGSPGQSEAYTVFCLDQLPDGCTAQQWLKDNRKAVAGLLTEEAGVPELSEQESDETVGQYISYYERDLAVVDWDAAVVVGQAESLEDVLHIVELANVQLAELEAYDRILDEALQGAYLDLSSRGGWLRQKVRRRLREIRVDLARFNDELTNITKFFGDWHLAKVYRQLFERFHLSQWHQVVGEKLRTLGELYGLLQQERNNFWMMVLEVTIVLLFILDLLLLLRG